MGISIMIMIHDYDRDDDCPARETQLCTCIWIILPRLDHFVRARGKMTMIIVQHAHHDDWMKTKIMAFMFWYFWHKRKSKYFFFLQVWSFCSEGETLVSGILWFKLSLCSEWLPIQLHWLFWSKTALQAPGTTQSSSGRSPPRSWRSLEGLSISRWGSICDVFCLIFCWPGCLGN